MTYKAYLNKGVLKIIPGTQPRVTEWEPCGGERGEGRAWHFVLKPPRPFQSMARVENPGVRRGSVYPHWQAAE